MIAVPANTPVTIPVLPTVAIDPSLLLHVPPVVEQLKDVVDAVHTLVVPVMDAGAAPTVAITVVLQPPTK